MGAPADVVLVLGARLGLFAGGRGAPLLPRGAKIIQVDVAAEEIGRNRDVDLGIAADVLETLRAFEAAAGRDWPERKAWRDTVQAARVRHHALFAGATEQEKAPIHPSRLAADIAKMLPRDAIVAADGGETASWMEMTAEPRAAAAGCRTATSAASAPAWPSRSRRRSRIPTRPCCASSATARWDSTSPSSTPWCGIACRSSCREQRPAVGHVGHGQQLLYGKDRKVVTELAPTRYDLAAAGFGCHAEHVVEPRDIIPALERAFASGRPACVNVMTDPDVIAPVTRMMVGGARPAEPAKEKIQLPLL